MKTKPMKRYTFNKYSQRKKCKKEPLVSIYFREESFYFLQHGLIVFMLTINLLSGIKKGMSLPSHSGEA